MAQSEPAVCGTFEREVIVKKKNIEAVKKALKAKGQMIVGTGPSGPTTKKLWYNPAGMNL